MLIRKGSIKLTLAERIAGLRKKGKLTQKELADRLGVTRSALSQYELGTRNPDYEFIQKAADFFEVSTDYLLGREIEKQLLDGLDEIDMEILEVFKDLSIDDQKYVIGLIKRLPRKQ